MLAESLGGVESLIEHPALMTADQTQAEARITALLCKRGDSNAALFGQAPAMALDALNFMQRFSG